MAHSAAKIERNRTVASDQAPEGNGSETVDESAIAARAYELWIGRGCPIGSAEEDWFRAEAELNRHSAVNSKAA